MVAPASAIRRRPLGRDQAEGIRRKGQIHANERGVADGRTRHLDFLRPTCQPGLWGPLGIRQRFVPSATTVHGLDSRPDLGGPICPGTPALRHAPNREQFRGFLGVRGDRKLTVSRVGCRMRNHAAENPITLLNPNAVIQAVACVDKSENPWNLPPR